MCKVLIPEIYGKVAYVSRSTYESQSKGKSSVKFTNKFVFLLSDYLPVPQRTVTQIEDRV